MREMSFDLEQSFFLEESSPIKDNHIFVTGLARAGSTILLKTIHASQEFASLTYADMPFVLAPNLWGKLNPTTKHSKVQERAHGDGIMVSTDSPEAFEEVYWQTFTKQDASDQFKNYIHLILRKYKKKRYLSKNNQNVVRLEEINKLLPLSTILIPFREPLQHANSLLNQHLRFSENQRKDKFIRDYMDWIGHREFGLSYCPIKIRGMSHKDPNLLNHWLEQWHFLYSNLFRNFKEQKNFIFVCYESLCSDDSVWIKLKDIIEIEKKYDFNFVESRKDIIQDFDPKLYGKCFKQYNELTGISI